MLYVLDPDNVSAANGVYPCIQAPNHFGGTFVSETGVVLVEICARFDLPSEETSTERSVGN